MKTWQPTPLYTTHTHAYQCEEADPCFAGAECRDLPEGYECGICPSGYTGGLLRGYDIIDARSLVQVMQFVELKIAVITIYGMTIYTYV